MNRLVNRAIAMSLSLATLVSAVPTIVAHADSMPIVTIGANLNEEQRQTVLDFFGVDENSVQIIEINNQMEREYLEGILPDSVIGTRTISCSYTMPTTSGGIQVKTANLNVVTDGMLANALLTSGIENCQVVATAPFEVSGTGALTGVFKAYEQSSETELDEDKKKLATEELVITGDLISEIIGDTTDAVTGESGEELTDEEGNYVKEITEAQILALVADIKVEIINGKLSEEKIKEIIDKHLAEYKVTLKEETYNALIEYMSKLSTVDYSDAIKEKLTDLSDSFLGSVDKIFDETGVDFKTDKNSILQFFENLINWLKELFGLNDDSSEVIEKAEDIKDKVTEFTGGIFDTLQQSDEIKIDSGVWSTEEAETDVTGEPSAETSTEADSETEADTEPVEEPANKPVEEHVEEPIEEPVDLDDIIADSATESIGTIDPAILEDEPYANCWKPLT